MSEFKIGDYVKTQTGVFFITGLKKEKETTVVFMVDSNGLEWKTSNIEMLSPSCGTRTCGSGRSSTQTRY